MKRGFTLIEICIGMLLLSLTLLGFLRINSFASHSAMDAYYKFMAQQLANEPIEVFRAMGYERIKNLDKKPLPGYPIGTTESIQEEVSGERYPVETSLFSRTIELEKVEEDGVKGFLVKVSVFPSGSNKISAWLVRQMVNATGLVIEEVTQ
ncbi:MAG: prepilin-type N-terminal cleavage/methylation domain-containing protein [Candidatus Riflebacteria bacterium]|nr:prepilin-type N-terminal cleavage/methylation domain-containing protein [Candidatus Riflebacteria bacterium]